MNDDDKAVKSIKIVIAAHKKYKMPAEEMYIPLHVGAEGKQEELGYIKDNTGENISDKNPSFCELTALYWAWKNLKAEYIGLVHYRRHLSYHQSGRNPFDRVLKFAEARDLCRQYKIILPQKRRYYIETLYSHYKHTHYAEQIDMARTVIGELYPEYLRSYDKAVKRTCGYMFNIMIMQEKLLDTYCSWLFPILFELEKRINKAELSAYQGRCYGRISEILFNVWLVYQLDWGIMQKGDIKEIPCVYMEKVNWPKKAIAFLKAKFFHVRYEGSF